jgi:hypothetical protein
MGDQLSFASLEFGAKKKRTKRDVFLGEMAAVVPWVTCGRRLGKSFMTDADMGGCGHVSGLLVRRL